MRSDDHLYPHILYTYGEGMELSMEFSSLNKLSEFGREGGRYNERITISWEFEYNFIAQTSRLLYIKYGLTGVWGVAKIATPPPRFRSLLS